MNKVFLDTNLIVYANDTLAAAEHARCHLLWSEDLNPGQLYATVHVENPFAAPPPRK